MARRALGGREARRDVIRYCSTERRGALPSRLVAAVAVRVRYRKGVVAAYVAVRAGRHFPRRRHLMRARQGPARGAVVEGRRGPGDRAMACRAVGRRKWRSGCRVRRIIGLLPGRQMASRVPAVGRGSRQRVVVVDVAVRAGRHFARRRHLVRIGQRETRRTVIKDCSSPRNGVMACRAVRDGKRRSRSCVRGVIGLLPGGQMASRIPAVVRHDTQAVVTVDVAGFAGRHLAAVGHQGVRVRQRETERGVVELAVGPLRDGVALGASHSRRGKARLDVIRHRAAERRRTVPRRLVAAHAVGRVQRVIIVDVAGRAGRG